MPESSVVRMIFKYYFMDNKGRIFVPGSEEAWLHCIISFGIEGGLSELCKVGQ
jgi:hypothetical protein